MPVSTPAMLGALAVTFVAALVQGTIGTGLDMLSVPILTLIDPALAPVPQLLVTLPPTVAMFRRERHAVEWVGAIRVAAARIPPAYSSASGCSRWPAGVSSRG